MRTLFVVADSSSAISNESGPLSLGAAPNEAITTTRAHARACVSALHCCSCFSLINVEF